MPESVRYYMVEVQSTQEQVYHTLRDKILSMELKPGTPISTNEMAALMGVSRTPVREAFLSLKTESLLTISPQKATRVSYINIDRVHQERFIRESLEVENLNGFVSIASQSQIDEMEKNLEAQKKAMKEKRYHDYIELDNAFHQYPFTVTGQELCLNVIRQMNGHYERIRLLTTWDEAIALNAIKEHEMLLELFRKKKAGTAQELLHHHLEELRKQEGHLKDLWPEYFDKA